MNRTEHQEAIVQHVKNNTGLTLVKAVAGSGKTFLLTEIAKEIPHNNGLMLAYNKSIATSSKKKFPSTTACMTTHSMAYRSVIIPNNLKVGNFSYRQITGKLDYLFKCDIVEYLREFCLSEHLDFKSFAKENNAEKYTKHVNLYLDKMLKGEIECTHDFYLKVFHIQLANGELEYEPFDFIMLDEAGDLNPVTLEIFKLLPSERKIAVGDPHQNIYSFNHTINCFELMENEGTEFTLPKSFRVPSFLAHGIERFCKTYLEEDMEFKGIEVKDRDNIQTRGYIARTNSSLIEKMIKLNQEKTPYGLVRRASEIFKLPMMVANLKYQGFIKDPNYKHIQADFDEWYEDTNLKLVYKTPLSYLAELYGDDFQLKQAIRVVARFGKSTIFDTYYEAKKHENSKQNLILTTAHSSKGLEFDEVTISNDLNDTIFDIVQAKKNNPDMPILQDQRDALNLYYVATTRALKNLINAVYITHTKEEIEAYYPEDLI